MSGWGLKWFGELLEWLYQLKGEKLMKKVRDDEESVLWSLLVIGIALLVCVLLQVYVGKDRPLIQPDRQGSIVKTDQKQVYLPELIQSWLDKEDNK